MFTQTHGLRLWKKLHFSSGIQDCKLQRKLVKSPSTKDLPRLLSALYGCGLFPGPSCLVSFHLLLLRIPQDWVRGECEGKRDLAFLSSFSPSPPPPRVPASLGRGIFQAASSLNHIIMMRRWTWTEIRLKSGRDTVFIKFPICWLSW